MIFIIFISLKIKNLLYSTTILKANKPYALEEYKYGTRIVSNNLRLSKKVAYEQSEKLLKKYKVIGATLMEHDIKYSSQCCMIPLL